MQPYKLNYSDLVIFYRLITFLRKKSAEFLVEVVLIFLIFYAKILVDSLDWVNLYMRILFEMLPVKSKVSYVSIAFFFAKILNIYKSLRHHKTDSKAKKNT